MKPAGAILMLFLCAACGGVNSSGARAAHEQQVAVSPTDTATVRRLCTAPDSVLAKLAPCVLRGDFVGVKKF